MSIIKQLVSRFYIAVQIIILVSGLSVSSIVNHVAADNPSTSITGKVTGPGGEALGNVTVYATLPGDTNSLYTTNTAYLYDNATHSDPGGIPSLALFSNGNDITTDYQEPGTFQLDVAPGTYDIHFVIGSENANPDNKFWISTVQTNVAVTAGTPSVINTQLSPLTDIHTLSGIIKDADGSLLPNFLVQAASAAGAVSTRTNANGQYSLVLPNLSSSSPIGWILQTFDYNQSTGHPPQMLAYNDGVLRKMNDDTIRSIQLPTPIHVHLKVTDKAGNPDPGQLVGVVSDGYYNNGDQVSPQVAASDYATTGTNGDATLALWPNSAALLCAAFVADDIQTCFNLTIQDNETIILRETDGITVHPVTPTNLTAVSPSSAPVLTWQSSNAERYFVYRDGELLADVADQTTYTDTDVTPGQHSYYIQAYLFSGELSAPSNTISVIVDGAPPTIDYMASPSANSNGWNNSPVTVSFTCSDDVSVASCSSPQTLSGEGANQTVTGTATDAVGNTTSITTTPINIDKTAPTISYTLSPAANADGWNNTNAIVTFTCSDALSGIAACPNPITVSTEAANQTVTGTAVDKAGNQRSLSATVNLDKTAPTASAATMSSTLILLSANETITANATDVLSGVVKGEYYIDTDPGQGNGQPMTYANGKVTATATFGSGLSIGNHTVYIRSKDKAGNWSTVTSKVFTYI